jgi:hypothetical protein
VGHARRVRACRSRDAEDVGRDGAMLAGASRISRAAVAVCMYCWIGRLAFSWRHWIHVSAWYVHLGNYVLRSVC